MTRPEVAALRDQCLAILDDLPNDAWAQAWEEMHSTAAARGVEAFASETDAVRIMADVLWSADLLPDYFPGTIG